MSNPSNEQPSSVTEQITQVENKLSQVNEILEAPEFSQEIYNRVTNLTSEVRITVVAIMQNNPTNAQSQRAYKLLQESTRLDKAANKRLRQYAVSLQKKRTQGHVKQPSDEDV